MSRRFPGRDQCVCTHCVVTLKDGRVEQPNFDTYKVLRIDEAPAIDVHLVQNGEPPGGLGEPGTSSIVPAVAKAIPPPASAYPGCRSTPACSRARHERLIRYRKLNSSEALGAQERRGLVATNVACCA